MHSTGSRSPATPLQFVGRCAGAHMRPPLTPRVHLGGGLIPTRICHAFKAGAPLRVRVAATATPSEPSKDEDKPIGLVKKVLVMKVLDIVFSGVVWMVFASFLILICRLGITHSHVVYKFLSETEAGNVLVVLSGLLNVFGKFLSDKLNAYHAGLSDKLDAYHAETRRGRAGLSDKLDAYHAETRRGRAGLSDKLDAYHAEARREQAEARKELVSINQSLNSVAVKLARIETNIEWMRGDYGGANGGSLVQGTRVSSTQPSREEKTSPEVEGGQRAPSVCTAYLRHGGLYTLSCYFLVSNSMLQ